MKADEVSKKVIGQCQMDIKGAGAVFRGTIALILRLISGAPPNTKPLEQPELSHSASEGIRIDSKQLCCSPGAAYLSIAPLKRLTDLPGHGFIQSEQVALPLRLQT